MAQRRLFHKIYTSRCCSLQEHNGAFIRRSTVQMPTACLQLFAACEYGRITVVWPCRCKCVFLAGCYNKCTYDATMGTTAMTTIELNQLYEQQIKPLPRPVRLQLLARIAQDLAVVD